MKVARRVENLPPYLFVEISRKIAEKKARGEDVVSFGIGDPDIPTPPHIINRLIEAARDPVNHRYPESEGLPELRKAVANWYQKRFGVSLDPEKEVSPLLGAKEGIGLLISTAQGAFNAAGVFAAMIVLAIVALGADFVLTSLEKRLLKWRPASF